MPLTTPEARPADAPPTAPPPVPEAPPDRVALPGNAYTALADGEVYSPPVSAATQLPETTVRSVGWGLFLCIVFTIASAYSGLMAVNPASSPVASNTRIRGT